MRDAVLAHCVCLSCCVAASECECKSDVEDVEQSEAKTFGKNRIAENLHVSAQPTHSTVHVMHLAWLSVEGSAFGPARCVCACAHVRACACVCMYQVKPLSSTLSVSTYIRMSRSLQNAVGEEGKGVRSGLVRSLPAHVHEMLPYWALRA